MSVKIDFEGRIREIDMANVGLKHSLTITGYMGMTLQAWEKCLTQPDDAVWLKAVGAAYWLMLAQDGEQVKITDVDFPVLKFGAALAEGWNAEARAEGQAEEDPTTPADGTGEAAQTPPVTG